MFLVVYEVTDRAGERYVVRTETSNVVDVLGREKIEVGVQQDNWGTIIDAFAGEGERMSDVELLELVRREGHVRVIIDEETAVYIWQME